MNELFVVYKKYLNDESLENTVTELVAAFNSEGIATKYADILEEKCDDGFTDFYVKKIPFSSFFVEVTDIVWNVEEDIIEDDNLPSVFLLTPVNLKFVINPDLDLVKSALKEIFGYEVKSCNFTIHKGE